MNLLTKVFSFVRKRLTNKFLNRQNSEKQTWALILDFNSYHNLSTFQPKLVPSTVNSAVEKNLITHLNTIKHKDQRRKNHSATPYINHPIGVANILTQEGHINDLHVIQAAILHDTVEDTDTTFEELEFHFGSKVADIVRECTDNKSLPKNERKHLQIVNAKNCSREAKLVKLADKLYNLRDLIAEVPNGWTDQRVSEYFEWAYKVVEELKGTNEEIEEELERIFKSNIHQNK